MKKKKLNYYRIFIFLVILISIIVVTVKLLNGEKYKETIDYKLISIGYSEEEISKLKSSLSNDYLNKLLNIKYNSEIVSFIDKKYFIFENIDKYLEYKSKNKKEEYNKIISIINTEANIDWIDEEKETDTSKNELMLVNRLYGLDKDYEPSDIIDVPTKYAYSGKKISESIMENIIELINAGKDEGYTFVVSDGYRSYEEQKKLYEMYASSYGMSEADTFVARPGHSEYETGLSFDLKPYNKIIEDVSENEEYNWLKKNAYKYGFIFRFDKEHEYLTGFTSSNWRLRYVGKEAAEIIYNENICFEEYYAFYVGR